MQTILSCPANLRGRTIILVFKFGKTPPRFKTLPVAKKSGLQKNGPVQKAINRRDKGVFRCGPLRFYSNIQTSVVLCGMSQQTLRLSLRPFWTTPNLTSQQKKQ